MMTQRYAFRLSLMGVLLGFFLGTGRVTAQTTESHDHGFTANGTYYTCGSQWAANYDYDAAVEQTRINNPAQYERMVSRAAAREKGERWVRTQSGAFVFSITDRADPTKGFKDVEATLRYHGDSILIFVDNRDTGQIKQSTIEALAEGLTKKVKAGANTRNPNKGIIYNDIDIFGNPPVNRKYDDYIASFLLTDIEEPPGLGGGGIIEGYFSPYDQTDRLGSNATNILYIDSHESLIFRNQSASAIESVIGTMAHEFQHLINYNRYPSGGGDAGTHWIYNEGLSEVASLRNGYSSRNAKDFLKEPNRFAFFSYPSGNADTVLRGYDRAMLWVHYLSERFGDDFLYRLAGATGQGLEPARGALAPTGSTDIESVFGAFWVANYIQNDTRFQGDPKYAYRLNLSSLKAGTANRSIPKSATQDVQLKGYGAFLPNFAGVGLLEDDPNAMKIEFHDGSRPYAVYGLKVTDNSITVDELELNTEYSYDRFKSMVFVIVNLAGDGNNISWTINGFLTGVEDYASNAGQLGFTSIVPNPVRGEARFSFNTAVSGDISLSLYDVRGQMVRDLEQTHYEPGTHSRVIDVSNLPAGVYTARLQDKTGALSVRQFVVVK